MSIKWFHTVFVWVLSLGLLYAQESRQKLDGEVLLVGSQEPVVAATVTVKTIHEGKVLGYASTDDGGRFSITYQLGTDSIEVTARGMAIETISLRVRSGEPFLSLKAKSKVMNLKEVIVAAPKIRQRGDTIDYTVSQFTDVTDRTIEDVLKKMPGIKVLSSGQITYQDRPISKFYIEGLDLLKGKYGLATKNLDASKVASVQVLENHQPIKVLKDVELPDEAAINLKLKKSALGAFFVNAQVGVGLPFPLLSNELIGMRFAEKSQQMAVLKNDNSGRNISSEVVSFYDQENFERRPFFSVMQPSTPPIDRQHSLFNESYLYSLNHLRAITKERHLTVNANYLDGKERATGESYSEIFMPTGLVNISEMMRTENRKRNLDVALTYEDNGEERYFYNKLNIAHRNGLEEGELIGTSTVDQTLELPSIYIADRFHLKRRKAKKMGNIDAGLLHTSQKNRFYVHPISSPFGGGSDRLLEESGYKMTQGDVATSWGLNREGYWSHFGLSAKVTDVTIETQQRWEDPLGTPAARADSLENDYRRTRLDLGFSYEWSLGKFSNGMLTVKLPVTYSFVKRSDRVEPTRLEDGSRHFLLFSPSLFFSYFLSSKKTLSFNIVTNSDIGSPETDLRGYVMGNYRSLRRNKGVLPKNRRGVGYGRYSYKNPLTTLFFTITGNASLTWSNVMPNVTFNGIMSSVEQVEKPHYQKGYGLGVTMGKSLSALSTDMSLALKYNGTDGKVLRNNFLAGTNYHSLTLSPQWTTSIGSRVVAKYDLNYSVGRYQIGEEVMPMMHSVRQSMEVAMVPLNRVILSLGAKHYYNNQIYGDGKSAWFANSSLRYKTDKMECRLDWTNMLNTSAFQTYMQNSMGVYQTRYQLRPAEVLLRVRFKLF